MKWNSKSSTRMAIGFAGYVIGLIALNALYREHSAYRYGLVLLVLLPLIYLASAIVRSISDMDEMWRKILCEAMAFSGVATGFTCFTYLFMRDMGAPEFHGEWAFYMMWGYYGIGAMISKRRYQ